MSTDLGSDLQKTQQSCLQELKIIQDPEALRDLEIKYLGRKGALTLLLHQLKDLSAEEKRTIGPIAQQVKTSIQEEFKSKKTAIESAEIDKKLHEEFFDITLLGTK